MHLFGSGSSGLGRKTQMDPANIAALSIAPRTLAVLLFGNSRAIAFYGRLGRLLKGKDIAK